MSEGFARGILRLGVSRCTMCKFRKVRHRAQSFPSDTMGEENFRFCGFETQFAYHIAYYEIVNI